MAIVVVVTLLLVGIAVAMHYQFLYSLHRVRPLPWHRRTRVVLAVLGALGAHMVEILLFGIGYYLLSQSGRFGTLEGDFDGGFADSVYFSFVTYTSLGFGDIVPVGPIRIMVGLVTIAGLVLIAWTVSFLFIGMQKYWGDK